MREVKWFSLGITLSAICTFLAACTPTEPAGGTSTSGTSSQVAAPQTNQSPYYGAVDFLDCEEVRGWVWNSLTPQTNVRVESYIDDKLTESLTAQTVRADLLNKLGTGRYGFSFKVPAAYKDSKPHTVKVKVADSEYTVPFFQGVSSTVECKP
jgi:hypothetical protein